MCKNGTNGKIEKNGTKWKIEKNGTKQKHIGKKHEKHTFSI